MTALEGKAMLLPLLRGDALAGDVRRAVERIEAEATAAAEQRLRPHIESLAVQAKGYRPTDSDDGLNIIRLIALCDAIDELAALLDSETPPPASPRQGEPVGLREALKRAEQAEADRDRARRAADDLVDAFVDIIVRIGSASEVAAAERIRSDWHAKPWTPG